MVELEISMALMSLSWALLVYDAFGALPGAGMGQRFTVWSLEPVMRYLGGWSRGAVNSSDDAGGVAEGSATAPIVSAWPVKVV